MDRQLKFFIAWAWLLIGSACDVDPAPGLYRCAQEDECPPKQRCDLRQLVCVAAGANLTNDGSAPDDESAQCSTPADCGLATNCTDVSCRAGVCVRAFIPQGTVLPEAQQLTGDCRKFVCDGSGGQIASADDSDVPRSDGNPCHRSSCQSGMPMIATAADSSVCNDTGQCQAGVCSVCKDTLDCTPSNACTRHLTQCNAANVASCVDSGQPLDGKICAAGQLCHAGTCGGGGACIEGAACAADAAGLARVCNAGACVYTCPSEPCGAGADPCQQGQWSCADPNVAPRCVPASRGTAADGAACGEGSVCHSGACVKPALVNGSFHDGLRGWTTTGDGQLFDISTDSFNGRTYVSTWVVSGPAGGVGGEYYTGSVFQRFVVPQDALALRFWVFGGNEQAYVRLRGPDDAELHKATGQAGNELHVPVSWDLRPYRGQTLKLAIEDDASDRVLTGFVSVNGFDVIREGAGPLVSSQWDMGLSGWELAGDARYFDVVDRPSFSLVQNGESVPQTDYGAQPGLSTYVRDPAAPNQGARATGTLSQAFTVPTDAVALRFQVYGGMEGRVLLTDDGAPVYAVNGPDEDAVKTPVTWDLTSQRGKRLTLTIEDASRDDSRGFIGVSGFDLITSYNGP